MKRQNKNNPKDNKIKELEDKITELTNNWKRALADYQNLERRSKEEKESLVKYAESTLIEKLLPGLDNLSTVARHLKDPNLEVSLKFLWDILEKEGLQKISALDCEFNPQTMHAIELITGFEKGKVTQICQDGYMFRDKVIRPAQVKVGAGKEEKENKPGENIKTD